MDKMAGCHDRVLYNLLQDKHMSSYPNILKKVSKIIFSFYFEGFSCELNFEVKATQVPIK